MRNRFRVTRTAWTSAGLLVAGLLTGCQSGPEVIRGDGTTHFPASASNVNSPAFAQVAAGQALPAGATPMVAGRMPTQPLVAGQPLVGSGGAVYPLQGAPTGLPTNVPAPSMIAGVPQPHMVAGMPQPQPIVNAPPQGQPIGVIQTANGPQYVYAETPTPAMPVAPAAAHTPPVMIAPPPSVPSAPAPVGNVPSYTAPVGHPTFVAPPPTTIPMPNLHIPSPTLPSNANFAPSETSGARTPEMLPPTVTVRPAGVMLPSAVPTNPGLGNYPSAPVVPASGVRLPATVKPIDDEIPDAPVFPGAK